MEPTSKLRELSKHYGVYTMTRAVLEDPRFGTCSGSSASHMHHYGDGGLAEHTLEVCDLAQMNNDFFSKKDRGCDPTLLFLSAIFHDAGKMWDYVPAAGSWISSPHKKLIHHINRSSILWNTVAMENRINPSQIDDVTHAILSHHGQPDWGSPVTPRTRLAWLLHLSDNLSARMDDCLRMEAFFANKHKG